MIVENLPALQRWLSVVLKPLCDADPEALTKYVIALMKKNVTEAVLRSSMEEQLDIFLQAETVPFVNRLFECLETKEYEQYAEEETEEPKSPQVLVETVADTSQPSTTTAYIDNINSVVTSTNQDETQQQASKLDDRGSEDSEKSDGERDEQRNKDNLAGEKRRQWKEKRSRSRSLSSELSPRGKRRCGAGWSKTTSRNEGSWSRHRWSPIKRRIRRDINRRRRSRSPHPLRSRSASRNLQNKSKKTVVSDRSKSGSPNRRARVTMSDSNPGWNPPSPESNSLLDNMTNKCSVKSVVVKPATSNSGNNSGCSTRNRCIDFDEKGVCLRGELCPFDHGSDPVILHEIVNNDLSTSPSFSGKIPCEKPINFMNAVVPARPPGPADEYFPESPSIVPPPRPPPPPPSFSPFGWGIPRRPMRGRHLGLEPFLGRGGGMMRPTLARHLGPPMFHGRHLITIPVEGVQHQRNHQSTMPLLPENPFAVGGARMVCRALFGVRGKGRGTFDYSRLGHRPGKMSGNCCLEVRKIPRESNKIESLINHFSRFGNVVSIQVCFDNDPEGALVTFCSHLDALNAYRSTDAVLNNRFIKVYWHNKDQQPDLPNINEASSNSIPAENYTKVAVEDDKHIMSITIENNSSSPHVSTYQQSQGTRAQSELVSVNNSESEVQDGGSSSSRNDSCATSPVAEVPVMKTPSRNNAFVKAKTQQNKEMMLLLTAQIAEQKRLITKLEEERHRMTSKQREEVMQIIKHLQTSCEELKSNIANDNSANSDLELLTSVPAITTGQNNCSSDEIKRKLLDAELAMYMSERRGR